MIENKKYKCVNCGKAASTLYRVYSPSVLKLSKCEICKKTVDKYIEYDPVIVMIDLVLMSKEAQRHIIYNTEFKSYWKLLIILIMLETYGVWRNDSLFNFAINTLCDIRNNNTINSTHIVLPINLSIPVSWKQDCDGWNHSQKDTPDLFIWERDFYIQFLSISAGIIMFLLTVHTLMAALRAISTRSDGAAPRRAAPARLLRAYCVGAASALCGVPALVWGAADAPPATRLSHYALAFLYGFVVFHSVLRVLFAAPRPATTVVLVASYCVKYLTTFRATPIVRHLIS